MDVRGREWVVLLYICKEINGVLQNLSFAMIELKLWRVMHGEKGTLQNLSLTKLKTSKLPYV